MRRLAGLVVFTTAIALVHLQSSGQDDNEKKFTPRLPPYYASIVTPAQRKEIYALQERYTDQIADLKAQLEELTRRRDAEIEAVLTPAQQQQLQKSRDLAAAKRKKAATAAK